MYKKTILAFSVYLLSYGLYAQNTEIIRVLREIEQNNKELQAFKSFMKSRQHFLKSGNNLADPQAGAYYLPWGEHAAGAYTEFQISQSFEFPIVYGVRSGLIQRQQVQMELEYRIKRHEMLLPAKNFLLELIYLNKKKAVEQVRVQQAKRVFDQVQELFEQEQIGVLAVNRAKVAWIQEQFRIEQIETDKRNLLLLLQNLNGGTEITFDQQEFTGELDLAALDSIWQDKQLTDPSYKILKQQEEVARQQIKLSKSRALPNLTAGFNYQGVSGSNYSGIFGGVSIPLWSNRNKVKAAEFKFEYQQAFSDVQFSAGFADFQKMYHNYQSLLGKYQEYQGTLSGLNSESLLLEAYELGEISFLEYYMELQFYRQAYDSMLEMELQLNRLKAEILKHQL